MKLFLDTADVDEIAAAYETGLLDGVTTNPTLILKSGRQPQDVIREIGQSFPALDSISAEVVADDVNGMMEQAEEYICMDGNITIKVPMTFPGLKTCKALSSIGHSVNVTLVFSLAQYILAKNAGADYVSPFVGRWEDNGVYGVDLINKIHEYNIKDSTFYHDYNANILAASIRDVRTVEACALAGADVCTMPPVVFWKMYKNIMTDKGLELFQKDWDSVDK
jgi:transaldolase